MNRDAKGRFCKAEGNKTPKPGKGTKDTKGSKKSAGVENKQISDILEDILKAFAKEGIVVGSVECIETTDGTINKASELDKVFKCESPCVGAAVGCIKDDINPDVIAKLFSAKEKMDKTPKGDKPQGTPIDWKYADPGWIEDLHDIYEEGCIPMTEEELREDIVDAMSDAYALVGGYMFYLNNKPKTKACTCKGKHGK